MRGVQRDAVIAVAVDAYLRRGVARGRIIAGQLLAATLNVAFDDAGITSSTYDPGTLGQLTFRPGYVADSLVGLTVNEVIDLANRALSGEDVGIPISDLNDALSTFNESFVDGTTTSNALALPEDATTATETDSDPVSPTTDSTSTQTQSDGTSTTSDATSTQTQSDGSSLTSVSDAAAQTQSDATSPQTHSDGTSPTTSDATTTSKTTTYKAFSGRTWPAAGTQTTDPTGAPDVELNELTPQTTTIPMRSKTVTRTVTYPDGTVRTTVLRPDATSTTTIYHPDGTIEVIEHRPGQKPAPTEDPKSSRHTMTNLNG